MIIIIVKFYLLVETSNPMFHSSHQNASCQSGPHYYSFQDHCQLMAACVQRGVNICSIKEGIVQYTMSELTNLIRVMEPLTINKEFVLMCTHWQVHNSCEITLTAITSKQHDYQHHKQILWHTFYKWKGCLHGILTTISANQAVTSYSYNLLITCWSWVFYFPSCWNSRRYKLHCLHSPSETL